MSRETVTPDDYTSSIARKFVEWAEGRGFEPYHYHGRFYFEGPAVDLDSVGDAYGCPVAFQVDGMGLGVVVYLGSPAKLKEEAS